MGGPIPKTPTGSVREYSDLRSDWGWKESDKQLFTRLQELSGTTPVLICLNRSRKEVVEGFTGMLPPYSAWRSFLFRFTQFGFTASHK